jgi:hypothetical protein
MIAVHSQGLFLHCGMGCDYAINPPTGLDVPMALDVKEQS